MRIPQWKSSALLAGLAMIAISAVALEPVHPPTLCDRFLAEKDIALCQQKAEKNNLDSYVAALCGQMDSDEAFQSCWALAAKAQVDPRRLEKCDNEKSEDEVRLNCLTSVLAEPGGRGRQPASPSKKASGFQKLEIKK